MSELAYDQSEIPQDLVATANKLPSEPGYVSSVRAGDQAIPIFTLSSPLPDLKKTYRLIVIPLLELEMVSRPVVSGGGDVF